MHDWMGAAACTGADPEQFFEKWSYRRTIRTYCDRCPVAAECLAYAQEFEDAYNKTHGVFGGTTPEYRAHLRKERKR